MKCIPEKRIYKRHSAQDGAHAAILSNCPKMGQIINISKGGLAFRYVADGEQLNGTFQMDIFLNGNGFYLKKVPFKIISDFYIDNKVPFSAVTIRQCGGQFGELTLSQVSQLDYFIGNHTLSEAF